MLMTSQELQTSFSSQKSVFVDANLSTRLSRLRALKDVVHLNRDRIIRAVARDFVRRDPRETRLVDIGSVLSAIVHLERNTKRYMSRRKVPTAAPYWPAKNYVLPQAKGVVGVMSPWNYPVNLALVPLATALAAGNSVMLRMSERTPATTALIARLLGDAFPPMIVQTVGGEADLAADFAALPFDHLVFTGSTSVGRKVALAAAENLTPVTLELGGKSPAFVGPEADLEEAAQRIAWGKIYNGGQTCVAPDYALVPEASVAKFRKVMLRHVRNWLKDDTAFTGPVDIDQARRLEGLVNEARQMGAKVTSVTNGGSERVFSVVIDAPPNARIMHEEIFGPILPVISYRTLEEAISYVSQRPRPLALYVFERRRSTINRILSQTWSGSVAINDVLLQFTQSALPFGGVGFSGMGRLHGRAGFDELSNIRGICHQRGIGRMTGAKMLYPGRDRLSLLALRLLRG